MSRGKRASQPPSGWKPAQTLDQAKLTYAAPIDDSTEPYVIDGAEWQAPRQLTLELLEAIRELVEKEGRWRQRATVQSNKNCVRDFATWVATWNDPNVSGMKQPQRIADLTASIWSAYALQLPDIPNSRRNLIQLALVLRATKKLTPEAAERILARKGSIEYGRVDHYSNEEYRAILAASKAVVRSAHARIAANYDEALTGEGHEGEPTRASILFEMLTTTYPKSKPKARLLGTVSHLTWRNNSRDRMESGVKILKAPARALLFATPAEVLAGMVLIAALRGLNLSQLESMRIPDRSVDSAGQLAQVATDKPRRGPNRRFSLEVFGDQGDDTDGRWLQRIEEMTEPIRHHLSLIGKPNDHLFLSMRGGKVMVRGTSTNDRGRMEWLKGLPVIDFTRIKRTFETRHAKETTQNTEAVHLAVYMARDPERIAEYQQVAAEGIQRAYGRAVEEIRLRFVDADSPELRTAEDSTFASCTDPNHEPRTGLPCQDGFLGCLTCPNAIAGTQHLPLMRYTLDVLEEARGAIPATQWEERFNAAHSQLTHLLASAPTPAVNRKVSKEQRSLVRLALGVEEINL